MRALLVDNAGGQQHAVRECLRGRGYRVDAVSDDREAIARAARESFDLIIIDLARPAESGLLVLHELRESNRESEILVLTTPGQIGDRITALIQGADDYLVKPFSCEELLARIGSAAGR